MTISPLLLLEELIKDNLQSLLPIQPQLIQRLHQVRYARVLPHMITNQSLASLIWARSKEAPADKELQLPLITRIPPSFRLCLEVAGVHLKAFKAAKNISSIIWPLITHDRVTTINSSRLGVQARHPWRWTHQRKRSHRCPTPTAFHTRELHRQTPSAWTLTPSLQTKAVSSSKHIHLAVDSEALSSRVKVIWGRVSHSHSSNITTSIWKLRLKWSLAILVKSFLVENRPDRNKKLRQRWMTSNKVSASSISSKEDSRGLMTKHRPHQLMELPKCSKHLIKVNSRKAVVETSAIKSNNCTASRSAVAIHKQTAVALWATHRSRHSPIDSNLCLRLPRGQWLIIVIRSIAGYRSNNRSSNRLDLILGQETHVRTLKISTKLLSKEVSAVAISIINSSNSNSQPRIPLKITRKLIQCQWLSVSWVIEQIPSSSHRQPRPVIATEEALEETIMLKRAHIIKQLSVIRPEIPFRLWEVLAEQPNSCITSSTNFSPATTIIIMQTPSHRPISYRSTRAVVFHYGNHMIRRQVVYTEMEV